MPPEKELITSGSVESVKTLIAIATMFAGGVVARILVSDEPFDAKKFAGEMIFAIIGAVILWSFGVLQDFSTWQMFLYGGLVSLGGVRFLEWIIKIARMVNLK